MTVSSTFIQQIHLTIKSDDITLLRSLRENAYGDLDLMLKNGVFSFRNGVAEIHRDTYGKIRLITIKQQTFKD